MSSVAILYIATGTYKSFWKYYYPSFEENFLPNCERDYYVFTDTPDFFEGFDRVYPSLFPASYMKWPLPTLMRFHLFLERAEELAAYDYILFTNANLRCNTPIYARDILPRRKRGERFVFVQHGGHVNDLVSQLPYERRTDEKGEGLSTAYIAPYEGQYYVMGGLNGGETKSFLEMCERLKRNIDTDLRNKLVAVWHDESHLNRFVVNRTDFRLLDPSYMYDGGGGWNFYEDKITILSKENYIDVDAIKLENEQ